jgi:hypothetical protein
MILSILPSLWPFFEHGHFVARPDSRQSPMPLLAGNGHELRKSVVMEP